jgi:GNAT superfamily N-acetyltransferase
MIRNASEADIDVLVLHHVSMFREIFTTEGRQFDESGMTGMATTYRRQLQEQMRDGTCVAWVIGEPGSALASAAVSIRMAVPPPLDDSRATGLLHSVYTEVGHRRKGYAQLLVKTAVDYCTKIGIRRIDLSASAAGKAMYEKRGFVDVKNAMRRFSADHA